MRKGLTLFTRKHTVLAAVCVLVCTFAPGSLLIFQMKTSFLNVLLIFLVVFGFSQVQAQSRTQNINLNQVISSFAAPEYPASFFDLLDNNGYERVDKQYLEYCDRVIYAFKKNEKPVVFYSPMLCSRLVRSEQYALKVKNELEIQFQKSGRPYFESLRAQIRKTCQALPDANGKVPSPKSKATTRAYRHEASGITFVVKGTAPVAYIYLLK